MKELPGGDYRDETRIVHMLQALERIERETMRTSRDRMFFDDTLTRAIVLDFIVLGEAANNVSEKYCSLHPEIPWADIAGIRHKLVHDYSGIDFGILWDSMTKDVPALLPLVRRLVAELGEEPGRPDNIEEFL
ncbi:MAG: DUF86 domain-containing protein [Kiritimatiellae bacterium]|nr:DUF86 domain-containing protein [Kiritimatiellia bacterium]